MFAYFNLLPGTQLSTQSINDTGYTLEICGVQILLFAQSIPTVSIGYESMQIWLTLYLGSYDQYQFYRCVNRVPRDCSYVQNALISVVLMAGIHCIINLVKRLWSSTVETVYFSTANILPIGSF